jgi:hypothetical protein
MSQTALEVFTRDVFLYTTRAGVRDEIDRIVASAMTEQPTVVVSCLPRSPVGFPLATRTTIFDRRVPAWSASDPESICAIAVSIASEAMAECV